MQGGTASAPCGPCASTSAFLRSPSHLSGSKAETRRQASLAASNSLSAKFSSLNGTAVVHSFPMGSPSVLSEVISVTASLLDSVFTGIKQHSDTEVRTGTLILTRRTILDLTNVLAEVQDDIFSLLGQKVTLQLVSVELDPSTNGPKLSSKGSLKALSKTGFEIEAEDEVYSVSFEVPNDFGEVGAFKIWNPLKNEFFLHSFTLEIPNGGTVQFPCNSWIYNERNYTQPRVMFSNKVYLPINTPAGLQVLRESELIALRGDGTGTRKDGERIYDYDLYNDLGHPDLIPSSKRPPIGGSKELPYPRRIRTGRPKSRADPLSEEGLPSFGDITFYIPVDESFSRVKGSGFLATGVKSVVHALGPLIDGAFESTPNTWGSVDQIKNLYKKGLDLSGPARQNADLVRKDRPFTFLSTIFDAEGTDKSVLRYPLPQILDANDKAWVTDEEYGRQTLAGLNPVVIKLLKEYPPKSSLDPSVYGEGTDLTDDHILPYLEGKTVAKAIKAKRLFTIDYHDLVLPYITKINATKNKAYAPRTIFYYTDGGKMTPVVIELSLPPSAPGQKAVNKVCTPYLTPEANDHIWELAKYYAASIDFDYHEVYSHFLRTHACAEPIIIAANRHLSRLHPVFTLLLPTFKNTMMINSVAREILINADGLIEITCSTNKYSMELSSVEYGSIWRFDQEALPKDLIARGMAEPADASFPGGVKLVVEDYPFAKDGLEIWEATKKYINKCVNIAYSSSDQAVQSDLELQSWWQEVINVGHGDKKDEPWWPKLDCIASLVEVLTTISWMVGPHHAAVNFGQYAYGGFVPNKPAQTRQFIPEKGTKEYEELQANPEKFMLGTIDSQTNSILFMTVLEILSTHADDEEYLGERLEANWTSDPQVQVAFKEYNASLRQIEKNQEARNADSTLVNRSGPAKLPYTLLYPSSTSGITGRGVPTSTSI